MVWGGGESAAAVVAGSGLATGRGGRMDVSRTSPSPGFPGVYAVGDVANIPAASGGDRSLSSARSPSSRAGGPRSNILRELRGEAAKPFQYKDKGIMAMIGRNAAVAEVGKHRHQVEGPVAFAAWLGVHAMLLSGAHSKTDAFLTWALGLLRPRPRRHRRGLVHAQAHRLGRRRRRRPDTSASSRRPDHHQNRRT